ncbi:MAG: PAS domain S-box protein, partial [Pseudomonadota bacterium]|nr:PAS domain S-box protein [Pseudomonadota bacterium]
MELQGWLRRNGVGATFRALAGLLPGAAVVVTDASRRVLFWSPEAERLFGHPAANVVGHPCPDGVVCDGEGGPRPYGAAVRVRRADGTNIHVRQYTSVLSDGAVPTGAIHVLVL